MASAKSADVKIVKKAVKKIPAKKKLPRVAVVTDDGYEHHHSFQLLTGAFVILKEAIKESKSLPPAWRDEFNSYIHSLVEIAHDDSDDSKAADAEAGQVTSGKTDKYVGMYDREDSRLELVCNAFRNGDTVLRSFAKRCTPLKISKNLFSGSETLYMMVYSSYDQEFGISHKAIQHILPYIVKVPGCSEINDIVILYP
jgi:mRNA-degrading endonuclease RelE of RelBE toxin-antitoxin system